jgi:hypothetical protein
MFPLCKNFYFRRQICPETLMKELKKTGETVRLPANKEKKPASEAFQKRTRLPTRCQSLRRGNSILAMGKPLSFLKNNKKARVAAV